MESLKEFFLLDTLENQIKVFKIVKSTHTIKIGITERNIRTLFDMVRAMMLHASFKWENGIDSSLWPMVVSYNTYVFNHLSNNKIIVPIDLFFGSHFPRHRLLDIHLWE